MKQVGILGGGQLARMLALAAHPLGIRCRVYDPATMPPAAAVAEHCRAEFDDVGALRRFAAGVDVVTYEFEHLPECAIATLDEHAYLRPNSRALRIARDRLIEKRFLASAGIETANYEAICAGDEEGRLAAVGDRLGLPVILKTRTHGYDGRGQAVLDGLGEAKGSMARFGAVDLICEGQVPFDRELSIIVVRGLGGEIATYPLVENHHGGGILRWTLAPGPGVDAELDAQARSIATRLVTKLDYVGALAIELFQVGSRLIVNELAPRVHNSGHWTIEGAETSQFENHLRAILGLPLGSTAPRGSWVLFNLLGDTPEPRRIFELPGAHLHMYDKQPRPGRKLGHVNCRSEDPLTDRPRLEGLLGLNSSTSCA